MSDPFVRTVRGDVPVKSLGTFLPHEHLFTDLRGPLTPHYAEGDPLAVEQVVKPYLDAAARAGVTALTECSTLGVGRNVAVLRHLADSTPIHLIAPTGVYKEGFIPADLLALDADALANCWVRDIIDGMEGTPARAGFIKVALSNDGPTDLEARNLHAAAQASRRTGAVIACHTIGGAAALRELQILETADHDLSRFIWVHAQTESQTALHLDAARRGVWLEFDSIGSEGQHDALLQAVLALIKAGCAANLLLSHDAGWYDPSQQDGIPQPHGFRGYTALFEQFIPALRANGVSDALIHQITVDNPARAYAITTSI